MKWFTGITDLQELRRGYRRLAVLHHPDKGGRTEDMQEINNEYEILSQQLIDGNVDFTEARKVYETQVSEELRNMVNQVINFDGVVVEIIGSWVWLTGNTKTYKEQIKSIGFTFSPKKTAWYWHCGHYRKRNRKQYDLEDIRNMWGSKVVEKDEEKSMERVES